MDPWKSWTVIAVVGVGAYWYYTNQRKEKRSPSLVTQPVQSFRRKVEAKNKRKKDAATGASDQVASDAVTAASVSLPSSSGEQAKTRKGRKNKPAKPGKSSGVDVAPEAPLVKEGARDDEVDDKEFAKQLTSVKTGTSLTSTGKAAKPPRTVKQSRINGVNNGADSALPDTKDVSGRSSTTGADADDDLSATNSPAFGAVRRGEEGVSDMLEAPAPGPSVLRLTESTQPQRSSAPKQPKSTEVQESKKQRQRKAKKEAEKAALDQAEKDRRILLEKQLRTARESRGEPAKNGVPVQPLPKSNAWAKPVNGTETVSAPLNEASRSTVPLLDTFDKVPRPVNENEQSTAVKRDPGSSVSDSKLSDLNWPSEEEQMRMLGEIEGSGSWHMVNGKKRHGGKKPESVNDVAAKSNRVKSGDVMNKVVESGDVTSYSVTSESAVTDPIPSGASAKAEEKPVDVKAKPNTAVAKPKNVAEESNAVGEKVKDLNQKPEHIAENSANIAEKSGDVAEKSENIAEESKDGEKSEDVPEKSNDVDEKATDVERKPAITAATQQPRKPKKGEYLPYKDKPHPLDSDWRVV